MTWKGMVRASADRGHGRSHKAARAMGGRRGGLSRREFLGTVGAGALAAAISTPGCGDQDETLAPIKPYPLGVAEGPPENSVPIAIERAGGLRGIGPRTTVIVKPNATGPLPPPTTTNLDVLRYVIREVAKKNPKRIILAERSFVPDKTLRTMKILGMADMADEEGAETMALDDEEWVEIFPEGAALWPDGLRVPKISQEDHVLVTVPVAKGHSITNYTMSLKLMFGFLHPDFRVKYFHPLSDVQTQSHMIAELNLAFRTGMVILDATKAMPYGGPVHHIEAEPGIVMASPDRVALDAGGLALLKAIGTWERIANIGVWDQPTLVRAVQLGYGALGPHDVKLIAPDVALSEPIASHLFTPPTA